jgi:hypothetical protein
VEARRGGGVKEAQQWTEAAKLARRRSAETVKKLKKHKNRQKSNTAKHQTKLGMEKAGMRKRDGAPGLGTSSKLLEPSARGTWGGGMVEAIPPPL